MNLQNSSRPFVLLSIALVLVALLFGLWPRGFDFSNHVVWLASHRGIEFDRFGEAFTAPVKEWGAGKGYLTKDFSIEIALKPDANHNDGFGFILAVHGGEDKTQLVVGQWRSWLIAMNGDDYAHRRREKRISVKLISGPPRYQLVTITTGSNGTRIYLDGRLVSEEALALAIPKGQKVRLFLGNSPDARHGWRGEIQGLVWYDHVLDRKDVKVHFQQWARRQGFAFVRESKPFLFYLFNEERGKRVIDHGCGNYDLKIPARMVVFQRKILSCDSVWSESGPGFIEDALVNLVGFIPIGFVLMITFVKRGRAFRKRYVLAAVGICFVVSLTIEILQTWIPSRSSDCRDLVLNTLGALFGTLIFVWGYRKIRA